MIEVEHLADVFEHSFSGDAWHGPSLMAILKDVDARKAAARPIGAAHSIWELVLHITGWEEAIRRRIEEKTKPQPVSADISRSIESGVDER